MQRCLQAMGGFQRKQLLCIIASGIAFLISIFGNIAFLRKNSYWSFHRDTMLYINVQGRELNRTIVKPIDGKEVLLVNLPTGYSVSVNRNNFSVVSKTLQAVSKKEDNKSDSDLQTMSAQKHTGNETKKFVDNNTSIYRTAKFSVSGKLSVQMTTVTGPPLTVGDDPYVISNRHICNGTGDKLFLVLVHTATDHVKRRNAFRETWANISVYQTYDIRVVFLLGLTKDNKSQAAIREENDMHRDIVQGNFRDTYHNLTHKGVMGLRWMTENCKQAKFVVKVDDDVFVNVLQLMNTTFQKHWNATRQIMGPVRWNGTAPVLRKGKWKVQTQELTNVTRYMTHCKGYFVILTGDVTKDLYSAAKVTPFFWIDDVYLFGMLPEKVGNIKFVNLKGLTLNEKHGLSCFGSEEKPCPLLVTNAHSNGAMVRLWQGMNRQNKNLAQKYLKL